MLPFWQWFSVETSGDMVPMSGVSDAQRFSIDSKSPHTEQTCYDYIRREALDFLSGLCEHEVIGAWQ